MTPKAAPKKRAKTARRNEPCESFQCPLKDLLEVFDRWGDETFGAFRQTRIEFLKAVRSLIDRRIDDLETDGKKPRRKGRVRKIEVED